MTEYLIVFKGDNFLPVHAMSFEKAMDVLEECIGDGAEMHYALEVEIISLPDYREGFDCTEKFDTALRHREQDREAEAREENRQGDYADFKHDLLKTG